MSVVRKGVQQPALRALLDRPLSRAWCVTSWITSTALFVLVVQIFGGVSPGDSAESVYSTWSIAHLNLACAYPPASHFAFPNVSSPFASTSPLYPIMSAIASAIFRIGHSVPFPSNAAMGAHCSNAYVAIYRWSVASHALNPTLKFAYMGWFVLMASVVVLLRTIGRGRNGWEAVTLLLMAIVPLVWMCVATYFHPQDLLALSCIIFAVSGAARRSWTLVGVLLGLAFASQPFALLAIAPMIVISPRSHRLSLLAGTIATVAVIDGSFILLSSGRALKTAVFGSSRLTIFGGSRFHAAGGTVLFATHLHGASLFVVSRALPVVCAFAIAIWAARRLGSGIRDIDVLMSILATALCMRLVFEENLFGYYFVAVAVTLLCIEVARGRLSGKVLVWIGMVTFAFNPVPWWLYVKLEVRGDGNIFFALSTIFEVLLVAAFLSGALRRHVRWYLIASAVVVALTCFPPMWGRAWEPMFAPHWLWQIILVPTGLILASDSLRSAIRNQESIHVPNVAEGLP